MLPGGMRGTARMRSRTLPCPLSGTPGGQAREDIYIICRRCCAPFGIASACVKCSSTSFLRFLTMSFIVAAIQPPLERLPRLRRDQDPLLARKLVCTCTRRQSRSQIPGRAWFSAFHPGETPN